MKSTGGLFAFILAVLLMLFSLSSSGKQAPYIPIDVFHRDVTNNVACTTCHTPGMQAPLKKTHPPKEECLVCHKAKKT